jgi:hypothetical protein
MTLHHRLVRSQPKNLKDMYLVAVKKLGKKWIPSVRPNAARSENREFI